MSKEEAVAKAIWDSRESRFPKRVQREPDDFDRSSGTWDAVVADARAAIAAADKWDAEERGRKEDAISAGVSDKSMPAVQAPHSYADLADSATTFDPEEQFDRDIDARKDRGS